MRENWFGLQINVEYSVALCSTGRGGRQSMFVFWIFKVTDPLPYRSSCRSTVISTIAKPPTIQLQKTFCPDFSHLASKCCLAVKKKERKKEKTKKQPLRHRRCVSHCISKPTSCLWYFEQATSSCVGLLTHGVKQLQEIIYPCYYSRNVSAERMILSFVAQRSSLLLKVIGEVQRFFFPSIQNE